MFAVDAEIMRVTYDLDRISEGSHKWEITFNTKKCSVMEFSKSSRRISGNHTLSNESQEKTEERDPGMIITGKLSFRKHINWITGKTYNLSNKKAAFTYLEEMVKKLITSKVSICSIHVIT